MSFGFVFARMFLDVLGVAWIFKAKMMVMTRVVVMMMMMMRMTMTMIMMMMFVMMVMKAAKELPNGAAFTVTDSCQYSEIIASVMRLIMSLLSARSTARQLVRPFIHSTESMQPILLAMTVHSTDARPRAPIPLK